MSDPLPTPPAAKPRNSYPVTGALVVLLLAGAGGYYWWVKSKNPTPPPVDELKTLRAFFEQVGTGLKLADGYADANGDLVADPPAAADKFLKVETIGFCVVPGGDPDKTAADQEEWKGLAAALEKATGKKVTYLADLHSVEDQLAAVKEGKLHVTAVNTGLVATAVNTAGFVPLFAPADDKGQFSYEMEILVPAGSPAKTPADLKGKSFGFVSLSSNSGAKAPLVALKDKFGMLPGRDYKFVMTGDHIRGVKEMIAGKHDAVCVANDLLARAVTAGDVKADQFRSIFKSDSFPPLCFGVPHHLPPDLLAKVKAGFADFKFSAADRYAKQGKTKFAPVDYKLNWAYVREIDAALYRLLDSK